MARGSAAALTLLTLATLHDSGATVYPQDCTSSWRAELVNQEGEWQGDAKFEVVDEKNLLYVIDLQDNAPFSLAEISLQAVQPDTSLLSMTLSLPLCDNDLFCPEPFRLQTTPGTMATLVSAVTLGLAHLTVHTTGPYPQRSSGMLALDCTSPPVLARTVTAPPRIACPLPQAPVAYQIPAGCTGVQERLQTHCGLSPQAVALASGFLYGANSQAAAGFGAGLSMCLPEGCQPCNIEPMALDTIQMTSDGHFQVLSDVPESQMAHHAACGHPAFPTLYDIPEDCDRFSDRAAVTCGLSMVELAAASASLRSGDFAGFIPGNSVCLPDDCNPCSDEGWFDVVMADVVDLDMQQRSALLGDDATGKVWDSSIGVMNAKDAGTKGRQEEWSRADESSELQDRVTSLLSALKFW